jgi:transcriptional regulator with XRE-family HTH domain
MQTGSDRGVPSGDAVGQLFGERAKAARTEAGMTQLQLQERLEAEFGINLDTSGITRIEAGTRQPRLGEAIAIAAILGLNLNDMTQTGPDLDYYMSGVVELMHESRETLLKLLRSVDRVTEFVQDNPGCLGDAGLESIFRDEFEWFWQRVGQEHLASGATATSKSVEKLKRQLLEVVTAGLVGSTKVLNAKTEQKRTAGRPPARAEPRLAAEQWEQNFKKLIAYVERHGDAKVPQFYNVDGSPLGAWVNTQRSRHAEGTLDADRERRLQTLPGWTWGARADMWEEGFSRLLEYVKDDGHARVPASYTVDGFKLGQWVAKQRANYKNRSLAADRRRRLEEIPGWTWDTSTQQWESAFRQLWEYVDRQGDARVPSEYTTDDGFRLGSWVVAQRSKYAEGTLTPDRKRRFEKLPDWTWDPVPRR